MRVFAILTLLTTSDRRITLQCLSAAQIGERFGEYFNPSPSPGQPSAYQAEVTHVVHIMGLDDAIKGVLGGMLRPQGALQRKSCELAILLRPPALFRIGGQ